MLNIIPIYRMDILYTKFFIISRMILIIYMVLLSVDSCEGVNISPSVSGYVDFLSFIPYILLIRYEIVAFKKNDQAQDTLRMFSNDMNMHLFKKEVRF